LGGRRIGVLGTRSEGKFSRESFFQHESKHKSKDAKDGGREEPNVDILRLGGSAPLSCCQLVLMGADVTLTDTLEAQLERHS
jgi:hypothetical protein